MHINTMRGTNESVFSITADVIVVLTHLVKNLKM